MPNRRNFLVLTAASLLPTTGRLIHPALAQAGGHASDFVKGIGDKLVAVVNGPGSERDKRERLTQIIDSGVDVEGVARFCLGRFWRNATPEQQKRYMELFHQVLVNNITSKLGDYQGVRFTMGRAQQRDDNDVVFHRRRTAEQSADQCRLDHQRRQRKPADHRCGRRGHIAPPDAAERLRILSEPQQQQHRCVDQRHAPAGGPSGLATLGVASHSYSTIL
jgi:ABC-type transporter MlaC component